VRQYLLYGVLLAVGVTLGAYSLFSRLEMVASFPLTLLMIGLVSLYYQRYKYEMLSLLGSREVTEIEGEIVGESTSSPVFDDECSFFVYSIKQFSEVYSEQSRGYWLPIAEGFGSRGITLKCDEFRQYNITFPEEKKISGDNEISISRDWDTLKFKSMGTRYVISDAGKKDKRKEPGDKLGGELREFLRSHEEIKRKDYSTLISTAFLDKKLNMSPKINETAFTEYTLGSGDNIYIVTKEIGVDSNIGTDDMILMTNMSPKEYRAYLLRPFYFSIGLSVSALAILGFMIAYAVMIVYGII
jgi:hypothetical protein